MYPNPTLLQNVIDENLNDYRAIPYFPFPVINDRHLTNLFCNLHLTLEQSASRLERESKFFQAFTYLIARYADCSFNLRRIRQESKAVMRVREYLEAYFEQDTSLEQLAHLTNLNPSYLVRVFRKEIGLPPHAFQTQVRIRRAKALLLQEQSISEVALAVGFADQSHLTRHFKRYVGITPGQYRLKVKNVQDI
ncbi:AraC family transcriptional regulator [Brasilonema sp. UFV-L1]|nr:AraC family transcriptional regulator [Brasilonema sp. UFV-L1]